MNGNFLNTFLATGMFIIIGAGIASMVYSLIVKKRFDDIHHQLNARMDELLTLTAKAAKAEGVKEEKERDHTKGE